MEDEDRDPFVFRQLEASADMDEEDEAGSEAGGDAGSEPGREAGSDAGSEPGGVEGEAGGVEGEAGGEAASEAGGASASEDQAVEDEAEEDSDEEQEEADASGPVLLPIVTGDAMLAMDREEAARTWDLFYRTDVVEAPREAARYARHALRIFAGEEPIEMLNMVKVRENYQEIAKAINQLVSVMRNHGLLPGGGAAGGGSGGSEEADRAARLAREVAHYRVFLGQLYSTAIAALGCAVRRANATGMFDVDEDPAKYPFLNAGEGATRMRSTAKLIYFFLGQAFLHGLRRENGVVFQQRYLEGTATHAWEPLYKMRDFIHDMARKEIHSEIWDLLHGDGSRVPQVEAYLVACRDPEFPTIARQRRYQSFRNGIYDVARDRFLPYGDPALTGDVVACNLHPQRRVDPAWFSDEAFRRDPCRIPTPHLDRILAEQGFAVAGDVYRWILGWVLGRPQHDLGAVEKHQRNGVFLLGHAGSGKSTLANIVQSFYADEDTGQINSGCEPKYALASLTGKYVWFCTEVKKNFALDMGMLLQMLEGEVRISIQKKHETAWSEKWTIPGVLAGNEIPAAWIDGGAGNSLVRRMLIVEFPNKPRRQDPNLRQRLLEELPAIMVKSNRLYQTIAASIGPDGDIDAAMPGYFHETLSRFRAKTQPFVYMIMNHPDLIRGVPQAQIHLLELKKVYRDWCSANGNRYSNLDDDEIRRQIASLGLRVVEFKNNETHEYKGKRHQGWFVFGLGLRAETEAAAYHGNGPSHSLSPSGHPPTAPMAAASAHRHAPAQGGGGVRPRGPEGGHHTPLLLPASQGAATPELFAAEGRAQRVPMEAHPSSGAPTLTSSHSAFRATAAAASRGPGFAAAASRGPGFAAAASRGPGFAAAATFEEQAELGGEDDEDGGDDF